MSLGTAFNHSVSMSITRWRICRHVRLLFITPSSARHPKLFLLNPICEVLDNTLVLFIARQCSGNFCTGNFGRRIIDATAIFVIGEFGLSYLCIFVLVLFLLILPNLKEGSAILISLRAAARCTTGVAFQAGAVAHHGEVAAFWAAFAFIAFHAGQCDLVCLALGLSDSWG